MVGMHLSCISPRRREEVRMRQTVAREPSTGRCPHTTLRQLTVSQQVDADRRMGS